VASLPDISVEFATEPNHDGEFWPYLRDVKTLARPWAIPGRAGLEHRIGGLEKADGSGNISYDPENHDRMVGLRAAKVAGIADDIPPVEVDHQPGARLLVLGWGSTYGPIGAAVRRVRGQGGKVAQAHLRHLNPFPANLGEVLAAYEQVLVPEMNTGQLRRLVRAEFLVDAKGYNRVRGLPFKAEELEHVIVEMLEGASRP
jgi:2-oxoglutarate ferredoxin oxidoreductase subunit alpha